MKTSSKLIIAALIFFLTASFCFPFFCPERESYTIPTKMISLSGDTLRLTPGRFSTIEFKESVSVSDTNMSGRERIEIEQTEGIRQPEILIDRGWLENVSVNVENDICTINIDGHKYKDNTKDDDTKYDFRLLYNPSDNNVLRVRIPVGEKLTVDSDWKSVLLINFKDAEVKVSSETLLEARDCMFRNLTFSK